MEHSHAYQDAKKRLEVRMGFYTHLSVYIAVILFLVILNVMTSAPLWFQWPALGWGVAVAIHAAVVFVFPGRFAVTEAMIEKEMGKAQLRSSDG